MRRGIAILSALMGGGFLVSGCGEATPVTLEVGETYCFAVGEDLASADKGSCDYSASIMLALTESSLGTLKVEGDEITFEEKLIIVDGKLTPTSGEESASIKTIEGGFRILQPDESEEGKIWLIPAKTRAGRQVERLNADLTKLEANSAPPTETNPYLNVPLCGKVVRFRNGEVRDQYDSCTSSGIVTIFVSGGTVISLPIRSGGDGDVVEFDTYGSWKKINNIPRPDEFSDFEWYEHEEGVLMTKLLREEKKYRLGSGQAYDPSVVESARAYTVYDGAEKDALTKAFAEEIYPSLRRLQMLEEYVPDYYNP